jgi:hypothetical protein
VNRKPFLFLTYRIQKSSLYVDYGGLMAGSHDPLAVAGGLLHASPALVMLPCVLDAFTHGLSWRRVIH